MGAGSSKADLADILVMLAQTDVSPEAHDFWDELWKLNTTAEDVFELISPDDVRQLKRERPENVVTLFTQAVAQLWEKVFEAGQLSVRKPTLAHRDSIRIRWNLPGGSRGLPGTPTAAQEEPMAFRGTSSSLCQAEWMHVLQNTSTWPRRATIGVGRCCT